MTPLASRPLGATDLSAAAGRLELALKDTGPVDDGLRAGFVASADTTLTALADLRIAADDDASAPGPESGCGERSQRIRELEALLEAGNTRALDHRPWLDNWVDNDAPAEVGELLRQIEALDFPAALVILRGLGGREQ